MLAVWRRNLKVWLKHIKASLIGNLGQPFLFLLAMGFGLGKSVPEIEGLSYLQFIAPGLVASAVMYSAAFEATYGSYTRLSTQGTFEAILMTPVSVTELALGEILWGATKGLVSGLIMLAAIPFFGVVPDPAVALILPVLFMEGVLFASMGLVMTATATNYEYFNYFTSLIITPFFLFSGIFFSLSAMKGLVGLVLSWLPLAEVVTISRALTYGHLGPGLLLNLAVLAIYTALFLSLAVALMRRRLIQ
jgi:lipooligosaccharide transport system permease protein